MVQREFEKCLRKITMMDYGMILIAHSQIKNIEVPAKDSTGEKVTTIEKVMPAMPDRAAKVVNQIVDVMAYIKTTYANNGEIKRTLLTRATENVVAGNRLKYLKSEIPFSYKDVVDAINDAIDKEAQDGATIVEKREEINVNDMTFNEIRNEAQELWGKLISQKTENANIIKQKIREVFGKEIKLSEITENQKDLFFLILLDMRELVN